MKPVFCYTGYSPVIGELLAHYGENLERIPFHHKQELAASILDGLREYREGWDFTATIAYAIAPELKLAYQLISKLNKLQLVRFVAAVVEQLEAEIYTESLETAARSY